MTFADACKEKFDRGHREHGETWSPEHINARKEMQGELCDLFNYSTLLQDEVLQVRIQAWCKDMWQELEDMGDESL